jgi:hypothetical protein
MRWPSPALPPVTSATSPFKSIGSLLQCEYAVESPPSLRKMCGTIHTILARGAAPVASQAPGAAPGIQPSATPLKRIAVSSLVRLALSRSTESGPGQASADRAGDPRSSPETPMVGVLPLNHAQGDLALHTPIDRRAFRRPSTPTNRAWNLPAPPAPNRG